MLPSVVRPALEFMTKKKRISRKAKIPKAGDRSGFLWGMAGTAAVLSILVYLLVIRPERSKVDLPGTPSYNVLLITLDTTRADHLGCYGYKPAKTPNLDKLAREGVRFTRAYCPAPLTLPSHVSIMTGLYPVTHGVRNNGHNLPLRNKDPGGDPERARLLHRSVRVLFFGGFPVWARSRLRRL